jgi:hypothetical protein
MNFNSQMCGFTLLDLARFGGRNTRFFAFRICTWENLNGFPGAAGPLYRHTKHAIPWHGLQMIWKKQTLGVSFALVTVLMI